MRKKNAGNYHLWWLGPAKLKLSITIHSPETRCHIITALAPVQTKGSYKMHNWCILSNLSISGIQHKTTNNNNDYNGQRRNLALGYTSQMGWWPRRGVYLQRGGSRQTDPQSFPFLGESWGPHMTWCYFVAVSNLGFNWTVYLRLTHLGQIGDNMELPIHIVNVTTALYQIGFTLQ